MQESKKILLALSLGAVVTTAAVTGVHAHVGNIAEDRLTALMKEVDRHPHYKVYHTYIDKGLFETDAKATIGIAGAENATADIDLTVYHGFLEAMISGSVTPNDIISGTLDFHLEATQEGLLSGQVSSSKLFNKTSGVSLNNLVVDVEQPSEHQWSIYAQATDLTAGQLGRTIKSITPSVRYDVEYAPDSASTLPDSTMAYEWRFPRTSDQTDGQGKALWQVDNLTFSGKTTQTDGIAQQQSRVAVDNVNAAGFTLTDGAIDLSANAMDIEALDQLVRHYTAKEVYRNQGRYTPYTRMMEGGAEQYGAMIGAMDGAYEFLSASPSLDINTIQADVHAKIFGTTLTPSATGNISFDGQDLPIGTVYSAFWDEQFKPSKYVAVLEGFGPAYVSQLALLERLKADIEVRTDPTALQMLQLIPNQGMEHLDRAAEVQRLTLENGKISINGNTIGRL